MSKEKETKFERFKKSVSDFFWWAPLTGVIADIIAISQLRIFRLTIQQTDTNNKGFNPPIFGGVTLDDAIFLTGLFTAFVITSLFFTAYKTREKTDKFSYVIATFLSLLLTYFYFRLWLGEKWWIFVCVAPIFVLLLIVISTFGNKVAGNGNFGEIGTTASVSKARIPQENYPPVPSIDASQSDDVMDKMRKTWSDKPKPKTNDKIMERLRKAWSSEKDKN